MVEPIKAQIIRLIDITKKTVTNGCQVLFSYVKTLRTKSLKVQKANAKFNTVVKAETILKFSKPSNFFLFTWINSDSLIEIDNVMVGQVEKLLLWQGISLARTYPHPYFTNLIFFSN